MKNQKLKKEKKKEKLFRRYIKIATGYGEKKSGYSYFCPIITSFDP